MKRLPKQHRRLFTAAAFLCLIFAGVYFIFIEPLRKKVAEDRKYIENTTKELHKSGYPLDPGRLAGVLQSKKMELEGSATAGKSQGIKNKVYSSLQFACKPLQNRVKKLFENPSDFTKDVGLLDYQEEYNALEQKLAARGIFLSDKILRLGEKSTAKGIYIMLLQVWMLDKISSLAIESGLRFQTEGSILAEDETGRKRQSAKIQFQPIIEYKIYDTDTNPYLMEIPLKIAFFGDTNRFADFLSKIQAEDNFFALGAIQMSLIPQLRKTETEFLLLSEGISIEMELSAFFSPKELNEIKKPTPEKIIPPGA